MKLLVHLHLYYHEQLDYFIKKLSNISGCEWDLYVTFSEQNTDSEKKILKLKTDAKFLKVSNIGYDIWPFIQVLKNINLEEYGYVLKLHSKRYIDFVWWPDDYEYKTNKKGFYWRNSLVEPLIGSKKKFKNILDSLNKNPNIGFVSDKSYMISIEKNSSDIDKEFYKNTCKELNITKKYPEFLAGTMFIIKTSVLKRVIHIQEEMFDTKSCQGASSTFAHALERIFTTLVYDEGYEIYLIDDCKKKFAALLYKIFHYKKYRRYCLK